MDDERRINRREFLKFVGVNLAALSFPDPWFAEQQLWRWPAYAIEDFPQWVGDVLRRIPKAQLDADGFLVLLDADGRSLGRTPMARTLWNIESSNPVDRLYADMPWGIVLHWYGDKDNYDRTVAGYLRGFDTLQDVGPYITRTSAHFLVGEGELDISPGDSGENISILQTQIPDTDGTPFVGSHLLPLDYQGHKEKQQYFVRALYQLSYEDPLVHSMLQDLFDGPKLDPNMRTIAIEITGHDFDDPVWFPCNQQIANVVSIVWAVMKRYGIVASDIMGHNEIQLGKADPGKKFMATIRYLIGAKALIESDGEMSKLVFGQFLGDGDEPIQAVRRYFKFVRDYLVSVSYPNRVYEWESTSKYWFLYDRLFDDLADSCLADYFCWPIVGEFALDGDIFLVPDNHEGVDIYRHGDPGTQPMVGEARLVANGTCIYLGESSGFHPGRVAMFRHRQPDGAEVVTIFGHIDELDDLQVGTCYPRGQRIGTLMVVGSGADCFLHFAVAFGDTWDSDLQKNPDIPLNVGPSWIRRRFMDPVHYLADRLVADNGEVEDESQGFKYQFE